MSVQRLFEPDAIAIVGASSTPGKIGHELAANLTDFDGSVYPVNPNGEGDLFGVPFVDSVAAIDERVDLALLCVPAKVVPDVLEECGEAGVGAAVIHAGGFAEAGGEGEQLQERIVEIADEHGVSLLGPNTSGFLRPGEDLFASFAGGVDTVPPGDLAVIAQSGGVAHTVAFNAAGEGRGLSAMVGLGNRANTGFEECIEYFDDDPATEAILLHVEGTEDARGLVEACRAADTPIVAYNVGREDVGDFAESHTGALTGQYDLYEGAFRQHGVVTVDSCTELLDAGTALAACPEPDGPNVGVVTAQAGPGIILADELRAAGATLPELTEETRGRIDEVLPGITFAENPVDTGRPMPEFGEVVEAVARDENVDVVVVYELFEEALGFPTEELRGLPAEVDKPILFATEGPDQPLREALSELEDANVPTFRLPERGASAAAALVSYARLRDREEVSAR